MEASLASIVALPQKDKTAAYLALLNSTLSSAPGTLSTDLQLYIDAIIADGTAQVVARQVLTEFVKEISNDTAIPDRETRKELIADTLAKIQAKVVTFEEQVCTLRETYADMLEEDDEFAEAAKVLIGIPLESGHRANQSEYKLKIYIRIVRLFLEEEDSTSAETYFNRASLIYHTTTDKVTQLMFKLSQARMFDFGRRFAEASAKYHELSYVGEIEESERFFMLGAAITCAVLAPAGPTRSRLLSSLFRDERSASTPHHTILSKMYLDQIIRQEEVTEFGSTLKAHQLARLPTGTLVAADDEDDEVPAGVVQKKGPETVLDRAVMEHNVLSASKIYNNITFKGLGLLLALTPSAAEVMARNMIQQSRLKGSLDQVSRLLIFDNAGGKEEGGVANVVIQSSLDDDLEKEEVGEGPETEKWDSQIRGTLQLVESIAERCDLLLRQRAE